MPGFGSGPFGRFGFGSSAWARNVLFDLIPSIYRQLDADNGNVLEALTEAVGPTLDNARGKIDAWRDLRNPLTVRTRYDEVTTLKLGNVREPDSEIEQRGFDGTIDNTRAFSSTTARFRPEDIGKTLLLSESSVPINNTRAFKIASVVSPTKVRCDPPLIQDAGPIRWVVKGFPTFPENELSIEVRSGDVTEITPGWVLFDGATEFTVTKRLQFFPMNGEARILTEREGYTGQVLSDGRFQAEVPFSQRDVGKPITIESTAVAANNGKFEIFKVDPTTPTRVTLNEPLTIAGANANGGVVYTLQPGNANVKVEHVVSGLLTPLSVSVKDTTITVALQTDVVGAVLSTANQVVAAITASLGASALVTAAATGTGLGLSAKAELTAIPGVSLALDAGPLYWAVLPYPELRVVGSAPPAGVIEQENVDLIISATPNQVSAQSAKWTSADVGKLLTIRGSTLGSNGVYPIVSVIDGQTCVVTASPALSAESNLTWETRTVSNMTDKLHVEAYAPSLIDYLGADFALTVDRRETEARQRSWVENSVRWMDVKGSEKGYEIISAISGFNASVRGLYRIRKYVYDSLPDVNTYVFGETGVGRFGTDGAFISTDPRTHFRANSAVFKNSDVDACLYLTNTSVVGNTDIYEIAEVIDAHTVALNPLSVTTVPEYGVGGVLLAPTVHWRIVRLYADQPPERPRYDDLNVELMQNIVGVSHFQMDYYCWDPQLVDNFTISISNVTPGVATGVPIFYTVTVTGLMQGTGNFSTARVVGDFSTWQITDTGGNTFFLESAPVLSAAGPPEVHTFKVFGSQPPALGTAVMKYNCVEVRSCDYCRAAVAAVVLTPGAIAGSTPSEIADALTIVEDRLQNEVRPEHVLLVPIYDDGVVTPYSLNPDVLNLIHIDALTGIMTEGGALLLTETSLPIVSE